MNPWDLIQYAGGVLGLMGAFLVSGASATQRGIGFSLLIASNAFLIAWAINAQAFGLLAMYMVYSATSVIGLRKNLRHQSAPET